MKEIQAMSPYLRQSETAQFLSQLYQNTIQTQMTSLSAEGSEARKTAKWLPSIYLGQAPEIDPYSQLINAGTQQLTTNAEVNTALNSSRSQQQQSAQIEIMLQNSEPYNAIETKEDHQMSTVNAKSQSNHSTNKNEKSGLKVNESVTDSEGLTSQMKNFNEDLHAGSSDVPLKSWPLEPNSLTIQPLQMFADVQQQEKAYVDREGKNGENAPQKNKKKPGYQSQPKKWHRNTKSQQLVTYGCDANMIEDKTQPAGGVSSQNFAKNKAQLSHIVATIEQVDNLVVSLDNVTKKSHLLQTQASGDTTQKTQQSTKISKDPQLQVAHSHRIITQPTDQPAKLLEEVSLSQLQTNSYSQKLLPAQNKVKNGHHSHRNLFGDDAGTLKSDDVSSIQGSISLLNQADGQKMTQQSNAKSNFNSIEHASTGEKQQVMGPRSNLTTMGQYEATSELMNFIKSGARKKSLPIINSEKRFMGSHHRTKSLIVPNLNLEAQELKKAQLKNQTDANIDSNNHFQRNLPLKQMRTKNNNRRFQQIMKDISMKAFKDAFAGYTEDKANQLQNQTSPLKASLIKANQAKQQIQIPTKSEASETSRTFGKGQGAASQVQQSRCGTFQELGHEDSKESYEQAQVSSFFSQAKLDPYQDFTQQQQNSIPRKRAGLGQRKQQPRQKQNLSQSPSPITVVDRNFQEQQQQSVEQLGLQTNQDLEGSFEATTRTESKVFGSQQKKLNHQDFMTSQPSGSLRQMVASKSIKAFHEGQSNRLLDKTTSQDEVLKKNSESKQFSAMKRNRSALKNYLFRRDQLPNYCPANGVPTQAELDDYYRIGLLKDIEDNQKFIKLKTGKDSQQLIKLKAIEQAPDVLPDSIDVHKLVLDKKEFMSFRKPKADNKDLCDIISPSKAKEEDMVPQASIEQQEQKLAMKLGQIASMLNDMHITNKNDTQKDPLGEKNSESQDEPEVSAAKLEHDFMVVLEQRNILKEYCRQFKKIKTHEHREYWETIKRVHAKKAKDNFDRMVEERQMKIEEEEAREKNKHTQRQKEILQKKKKEQMEEKARIRRRKAYEQRFKADESQIVNPCTDSDSSEDSQKEHGGNNSFEQVHRRVLKQKEKRDLTRRVSKLIEFQKNLVAQFDAIQLEIMQEQEDLKPIDFEKTTTTKEEVEALMFRRLDHRIFDIFYKTELFYQYHQEVEANLKQMHINSVSKQFAKEQNQRMETRIEQQMKELVPHLMPSAQLISNQTAKDFNSAKTNEDAGQSIIETYKEIQLSLRDNIKKIWMKNFTNMSDEIQEQSSERSESSKFLETETVNSSIGFQLNAKGCLEVEETKDHTPFNETLQCNDFRKNEKSPSSRNYKTAHNMNNSFNLQTSLQAEKSFHLSAAQGSNLRKVENKLKRTVAHFESDTSFFRQQQNVLVSAFSKTLARNLHRSIINFEDEMMQRVSSKLQLRAEFGKNFGEHSSNNLDNLLERSISEAVDNFKMRLSIAEDSQLNEKFNSDMKAMNKKIQEHCQLRRHRKVASKTNQKYNSPGRSSVMTEKSVKKGPEKMQSAQASQQHRTSSYNLFAPGSDQNHITERVKQVLKQEITNQMVDLPVEQQQLLKEAKTKKIAATKTIFVKQVIKTLGLPLPILNKIQDKFLFLNSYQIDQENFVQLTQSFCQIVPHDLTKIALINNRLNDFSISKLFQGLASLEHGPKILAISRNSIGPLAVEQACKFLGSDAACGLKRFILKDPIPFQAQILEPLISQLPQSAMMMYQLKELVLQRVGMTKDDLLSICSFMTSVQSLKILNISSNGLTQSDMNYFFDALKPQAYQITHLNLSWNQMHDESRTQDSVLEFRSKFANFLRHSRTIQHLDLNGVRFSEPTLKHITIWGFRKSKTLLSIHMSGNFPNESLLQKFRKWINIYRIVRRLPRQHQDKSNQQMESVITNDISDSLLSVSQIITESFNNPLPQSSQSRDTAEFAQDQSISDSNETKANNQVSSSSQSQKIHDYSLSSVQNVKKTLEIQYKEALRHHNTNKLAEQTCQEKLEKELHKPAFQVAIMDRIVFQRYLGHHEIINGYRWREVDENFCFLCNKWSYCIFMYDKKLAKCDQFYHTVQNRNIMAERQKSQLSPAYISIESIQQILPMIPVQHFISRLAANDASRLERNVKEKQIINERTDLVQRVNQYDQRVQQKRRIEKQKDVKIESKPFKWNYNMTKYLKNVISGIEPQGSISIDNNDLMHLFEQSCQDESLLVCAHYLPPKITTAIVQDQRQSFSSVTFLDIKAQKFTKVPFKKTRKVKMQPRFNKETSVFKDYKEETEDLVKKQLEYDSTLSKISRFIKDPDEVIRCNEILLKYYRPLRDQFFTQIAKVESYPFIDWIDFTNSCQVWTLLDANLDLKDIDRIFIATNVELEDQEANDDRSLCRFEFYEIIIRMAKRKYFERKIVSTMSEALQRILLEHILPKAPLKMDSVRWREIFLWTLPVDELLRENLEALECLFQKLKMKKHKAIHIKKMLEFIAELPIQVSEDTVTLAFSFCKMQFVDELEQIEQYKQISFVEFLEFLGRLAWLIWENVDETLDTKLWRLLQVFFDTINFEVKVSEQNNEIDSESDYEDEIAQQILLEKHPKDLYSGFGLLKRSNEEEKLQIPAELEKDPRRDYVANLFAKVVKKHRNITPVPEIIQEEITNEEPQ